MKTGNVTTLPPSATSPPRFRESPDAIDHLFIRLAHFYGAPWLDRWQGLKLDEVKRDWATALADVTLEQVRLALDNLKSTFPPTLPEFRDLCRQYRRVEIRKSEPHVVYPSRIPKEAWKVIREMVQKTEVESAKSE
jgi:hypothetical protein